MAVLPEVPVTAEDVRIEYIQLCRSDNQTPEEIDRLRQRIWKFRHLLIGKGNALPPAARGVVCDIDVGGARPIALNLTRVMIYPMPLVNDLLENPKSTLWYCSLDMASGFWVVKMTDRARLISACITPFVLFEWNRMVFGLKNAPQIYQRMIDNALYGFTRIPKSEDHESTLDVFEDGVPGGFRQDIGAWASYIGDILIPADNRDQLCDRVEGLIEACDKWNLAISVVKSFWGMAKVEYLANPKDLSALTDLAFPGSLRAMQSFWGSLNYYSRFIEDYAIYASVLYELRETDFAAMMKEATQARIQQVLEEEDGVDHRKTLDLEAPDPTEVDPRWTHAHRSLTVLKTRIATTSILRHFDPDRKASVVVYASDWAISGSLMQEYDQIYYCEASNELNYGIAEKEVLALLRILYLDYNALVGRPIHVLTRHSTLAWIFRSTVLQGRLGQWAALLSPWTPEITKCVKGEDEILGALVASITLRSEVDRSLISIAPKKEPRRKIQALIPTIRRDEELYVVSFDGSAPVKRDGGA
ncbi:LOW QUALITY PROTEIN: reverse transcriptase [Phytophthora megakarya]|uniref:Reverse transcriptase n=1 Tax=Phytophthora megakarya TaxID=4795 RepID=A0A225VBT1_9STRA|nr:LOW QUALITY PROTEIN: reverse transcriptase [Phytophthora megakarya]